MVDKIKVDEIIQWDLQIVQKKCMNSTVKLTIFSVKKKIHPNAMQSKRTLRKWAKI